LKFVIISYGTVSIGYKLTVSSRRI